MNRMISRNLETGSNDIYNSMANAFCVLLVVVAICFAYVAVQSTRGSDQFWYLADTETLVETGEVHSNLTMPGLVLRQNNGTPKTPFYHNGPIVHINAVISKVTGFDPFVVWKTTNFLFALATALFACLVVANLSNYQFGFYAFTIYILNPLNIWQSVNLLQETSYAFLFSVQFFVATRKRCSLLLFSLLLVSLLLGAYSHPFFKLMMLAMCVVFIVQRRYGMAAILFASFVLVLLTDKQFFPSSFPPDLKSLIAHSVPGKSNNLWIQSDLVFSVTPELLLLKLTTAITKQFSGITTPIMSIMTYLSIPAFLLLLFKRESASIRLLWLGGFAFCLYSGIVLLQQFQFRYQQIIAPSAIALVLVALFYGFRQYGVKIVLGLALLFFVVDIKLISEARSDAVKFEQSTQKFQDFVGSYPLTHRIAFITDRQFGNYMHLVYASKPRQTMVVGTDWLSDGGYTRSLDLFQPDVYIYDKPSLENRMAGDEMPIEISAFHLVGDLYYKEAER